MGKPVKKQRGSRVYRLRLSGDLESDVKRAARRTVGGFSGLVREGLALRLYGRPTRNNSRRARRAA